MAPFVALLAVTWLAWLLAAPFLITPLSAIAYAIGSLVCHQLPDRSFHVGGFQLPVCARCLGIYAGAAFAAVIGAVRSSSRIGQPAKLTTRAARWIVALAALPTAISVGFEAGGVWHGTNAMRAVAGFPVGLAAAFVVVSVLATLHYKRCVPRRPTAPSQPPPI